VGEQGFKLFEEEVGFMVVRGGVDVGQGEDTDVVEVKGTVR